MLRSFGLDVHLDFCEVAVCEDGRVSQLGRIASTPEAICEFARGLSSEDQVVLEASCGAMMIARLLRVSAVGRVVVCNAAETRAISHARVKSDRFDAAMLAKLLAAGMLGEVWVPDEATGALRRSRVRIPSSASPSSASSKAPPRRQISHSLTLRSPQTVWGLRRIQPRQW